MPTYSALTTLVGKAKAEALGLAMERLNPEPVGIGVFKIEDGSELWEVGGYFIRTPDEAGLALLAVAYGAKPFAVSELPRVDWVAQVRRVLAPVRAGRFFVYGSHDADKVPKGAKGLLIEVSMAFGTGHHGSTQGCLRALDRMIRGGLHARNVADIGCGTAVLALAAARTWPGAAVLASDIDPVAIEVAAANAGANGMAGRIRCIRAAGFSHPDIAARVPFDLVFANILKGPLTKLAGAMAAAIAGGGYCILSGILNRQAGGIIATYGAAGFALDHGRAVGDWTTLTLRRCRDPTHLP